MEDDDDEENERDITSRSVIREDNVKNFQPEGTRDETDMKMMKKKMNKIENTDLGSEALM